MTANSGQECRIAIIDISGRRQLEGQLEILHDDIATRAAELAAANIELAAANIELEAFNYTVSHDLRKPLSIIHGYCQLVQELCRDQLDEQTKEFIREIYEGTKSMNRLITSLLRFSRVTRTEMRRETVDMSAMAKAVAAELQLLEPERRVSFRIAEGITGNGDAGLWRIALDNLIGNAWKYSVNREEAVIEFDMTEVDGKPACFVRDNGPGFDMAHADKLYVPFQRIPGIDVEGHGIGLATVERIVKRHGGRIWAESEPGKGATFFFTMEGIETRAT
jgi:light-regulated signal transduction histidine kinase (bacteriophytochrome)